jgi:hypothetical protein
MYWCSLGRKTQSERHKKEIEGWSWTIYWRSLEKQSEGETVPAVGPSEPPRHKTTETGTPLGFGRGRERREREERVGGREISGYALSALHAPSYTRLY